MRTFFVGLSLGCSALLPLAGCAGGGGGDAGGGATLGVPAGLVATPRPAYFDLSWAPVAAVEDYIVYVASVPHVGPDNFWLVPDGRRQIVRGATSATFGAYGGSQVLYARVGALLGTDEGPLSDPASVLLPPDAPHFVIPQAAIGAVELRVAAAAGATEYEIFLAADDSVTSENYLTLPEGRFEPLLSFVHRVSGLENGRTYFFVVRARNASGVSRDSLRVSATPSVRGSFGSARTSGVGAGPVAVATADFDGDGRLDLATANAQDGTASVLLGDGAGAFGSRTDHAVGGAPVAILAGDVSGDGRADLVTANADAGTVSVLLGDGAGGFAPAVDHAAGTRPEAVGAGDFDLDGEIDLVVADSVGVASPESAGNAMHWLRGIGGGAFDAPVATEVGAGPTSLAVADFDGDGFLDVALAAAVDGLVTVLYGDGSGAFPRRTDVPTGVDCRSIALGDFDRDGLPDVAALAAGNQVVAILLSTGAGGFLPPAYMGTDGDATAFAVADVDGDARLDFLIADGATTSVAVMVGRSGEFWRLTDLATSPVPTAMTVADVDGDGILDAIVTNSLTGSVQVMLGQA
jgi:hypothetical protein